MKTPLPPEFDAMAQRFVELWQEQWMQFANNKEGASAMQKITELMAQPATFNQFLKQAGEHDSTAPFKQAAEKTMAAGAKATSVTLDTLAQQLAQLARRVDALSEQLAAGPRAQPRAQKSRAKPAAKKPAKPKLAAKRTGANSKRKAK